MASNRVGLEEATPTKITFHGGSFIAGPEGEIAAQVGLSCGLAGPARRGQEGGNHPFSTALRA